MRLVVAKCSAVYSGRGDTVLREATRAILLKEDGSVSIHNDASNKPLNYMGAGNAHTVEHHADGTQSWVFDLRREVLRIHLKQIISDTGSHLLDSELGLVRDGTEKDLQAYLAGNPDAILPGSTFVAREYATGEGPVDLALRDRDGNLVVVEVKRTAMLPAVDQLRRYVEAARSDEEPGTYGILAALDVRPKTILLADKRGIAWVALDLPLDWKGQNASGVDAEELPPVELPQRVETVTEIPTKPARKTRKKEGSAAPTEQPPAG